MSTQEQSESRSLESRNRKPLKRIQEFLKELKVTIGLVRELEIKWEKIELRFYRSVIAIMGIVELLKIFWHSIWH